MQVPSFHSPAMCFTKPITNTISFRSCFPAPAVFSQGSSCSFIFYFLQSHYVRTGSHKFCHLLWKLKGSVCWGGGWRTTHTTSAVNFFQMRAESNVQEASVDWAETQPSNSLRWVLEKYLGPLLSIYLEREESPNCEAIWEKCPFFLSHRSPSPSPALSLPSFCSCTICPNDFSFCVRITHEDFAIGTDVLGPPSLHYDAQPFSAAQG